MKRILGVIIAILIIVVGALVGYKFIYKLSPREFITDETRVVYALENISAKDIDKIKSIIIDDKIKDQLEKNKDNLKKYVSSIYMYINKDLDEIRSGEMPIVFICDPGYYYLAVAADIDKYFEKVEDGVYVTKADKNGKYVTGKKMYLKPYRGLFIFAENPDMLKSFIAGKEKHVYRKNIEEALDENRDSLLGVAVYESPKTEMFGIEYVTFTGNIENENVITNYGIHLNEDTKNLVKNTTNNRELIKYVGENDIYIAVDDFSKLENIIFNPLVIGQSMDKDTIISLWKTLLGIDIRAMMREIDGEIVVTSVFSDNIGAVVKLKSQSPEIRNMIDLVKTQGEILGIENMADIKDDILTLGNVEIEENSDKYSMPKGTFIFADLHGPYPLEIPDVNVKIVGQDGVVNIEITMTEETLRELQESMR